MPIPGARNPAHLAENLGELRVELTVADLREIGEGFAAITIQGGQMNALQMTVVYHRA